MKDLTSSVYTFEKLITGNYLYKEKEYFKPYLLSAKRIMLIGVNFDTKTGRLSDWKNEEVEKYNDDNVIDSPELQIFSNE